MITREEIIRLTNEALKKEFELTDEQLKPEAHLQNDVGLDSLGEAFSRMGENW